MDNIDQLEETNISVVHIIGMLILYIYFRIRYGKDLSTKRNSFQVSL